MTNFTILFIDKKCKPQLPKFNIIVLEIIMLYFKLKKKITLGFYIMLGSMYLALYVI